VAQRNECLAVVNTAMNIWVHYKADHVFRSSVANYLSRRTLSAPWSKLFLKQLVAVLENRHYEYEMLL